MVPNPFTDRVMMIVVESGDVKLNQWVSEERNLYEDYKKAFGKEPHLISGVAIMTDTDNTGESATAYYGDILFKKINLTLPFSPEGEGWGEGIRISVTGILGLFDYWRLEFGD
jgi:hypothetical protein